MNRLDVFLITAVFLIIAVPLIFTISVNSNKADEEAPVSQVNLFISNSFKDYFGAEITENLFLEFEELYPDIFISAADDTQEPDIFIFNESGFNIYAAANAVLTAIPLVSFMDLLFYNIDILTAAGFDSPPKTREEFTAYCGVISGADLNAAAAAISLSDKDRGGLSRDIFSWIWAGGGNFWADGDKPFLNTRAIVNDIAFFGTLYSEGMYAPRIFETTGDQRLEDFARGRIAMMAASARVIPFLRDRMREGSFGITSIPDANTGGRYNTGISSLYAAISSNSQYPDEALIFLEFLSEKSFILCEEMKAVPGIISNIIPGNYVADDPYYSKAWEIFEFAQTAEGFSGNPNAVKYETAFLEELRIFFESTRTAQQTVTAIQRRWDEIYDDE